MNWENLKRKFAELRLKMPTTFLSGITVAEKMVFSELKAHYDKLPDNDYVYRRYHELSAENKRLKEQNETLTGIAMLNSDEVARLQKELARGDEESDKERIKRLEKALWAVQERVTVEQKAFDLMCTHFGCSLEDIASGTAGMKKSSGWLWAHFMELAYDSLGLTDCHSGERIKILEKALELSCGNLDIAQTGLAPSKELVNTLIDEQVKKYVNQAKAELAKEQQ